MAATLSLNDGVLMISLLYLSIDLQYQWQDFVGCQWPVHRWLLVSYFFIVAFRVAHIVGSMHAAVGSGDFLLNLRHKDNLPQLLMSMTWLLVLPLFAIWTCIGSYWLYESKRLSSTCLPMGMALYFIITWQVLSYAWIMIHCTLGGIAWVLEYRLRRAEESFRALADSDTVSRWGAGVGQMSDYTALANNSLGGLTPDQIKALPEAQAGTMKLDEMECSICLAPLGADESARQLPGCGHCFHRCCIDLWLLRRADCPLCKQDVLVSGDAPPCEHWHA
jgi:hypothetical protein